MIDEIKNETIALFTKAWVWILSTVFGMLVGIIGKYPMRFCRVGKLHFGACVLHLEQVCFAAL
ncbi:hypothetical protein VF04_33925 [Nostoc linckia z7]|uniref:Uncharacterized protein n=1 Tax=Nostoc linckia z7 TaxID=1628745 RepID=A0ABX4KKD7_NOSLI|nr:hypothetical protein VF04_33925 [Nostoc linckia z7]